MALSPMMQQYMKIKEQYPNTIVFYRLGDFYEMFFDDAILVSRELELTLTGRDCGLAERAPMCGVPFHAVDTYMARLLEKGYKVAICEQTTKPGEQKGLVERNIVREVTPGTKIDSEMLQDNKNNYLMSIFAQNGAVGASWVDISTGEFNHVQFDAQVGLHLNELLARVNPSEIICNNEMLAQSVDLSLVKFGGVCPFTLFDETAYEYDTALSVVKENLKDRKSLTEKKLCVCSSGALFTYLNRTQKRALKHISCSILEKSDEFMGIDSSARKTLELLASFNDNSKQRGSLYWFLNHTSTAMGARILRSWLEKPSLNEAEINNRLDLVQYLSGDAVKVAKLSEILSGICDIERIAGRASYGNISPKDCRALGDSLIALRGLIGYINSLDNAFIHDICAQIPDFTELGDLLVSAIFPSPNMLIRDGGVIADGFDQKLDEYRTFHTDSKAVLKRLEEKEREITGIKNLKVAYNRVFGYYIEVTNSQLGQVPYNYIRRQTITTGERFITEELKEIETQIMSAEENAKQREQLIFEQIVQKINDRVDDILQCAKKIAYIDCLTSHAQVARMKGYVKPTIGSDVGDLKIIEGRHCVVEKILGEGTFVPNDTVIDGDQNRIMLITGPNMAGKSVYMRQVAIIAIMAHIGCYVPAASAQIPIIDKIFTRVGASDDLSTGRSTFMVEMSEVANILENATDKSLLLLDEIGRGTATFDGLSIAWAIIEHLSTKLKAKTLFSTHYHELTELEDVYEGLKNYKMTVREFKGNIIFTRRLMRGSANKSFGIEVAGLAGLPEDILLKAKALLKKLEKSDIARKEREETNYQLSIFTNNSNNEVVTILKEIVLDDLTPRKAFDIICDLKEKVDNERN